ncbi:hypothetical protein OHA57_38855 (plasmid) [Streptomyces anulatus]|uniref:hypothetical protein n=1 Tax=Streptomyces anulatus TaxID=1892 RepID=UPI002DD818FD|nr:hypothetical protein [Streptomyces anulatus]MDF9809032.1 hypothetical protein [Streptomyces sp. HB372]WSC66742.1 hypothetical protein OHA57_38855 [Streptomyces anulatus]WSR80212.1 hypothetical protein OG274_35370 [Streptomyces anulatus]WUC91894.1 hypothetical protein OHQ35_37845 [Streptomyces anulatus]
MDSKRHDVASSATVGVAVRTIDVPGAIQLVVPGNVWALDPGPAMFGPMLRGWEQQQQIRLLARKTIDALAASVRSDSPDDTTDATRVDETAAAEPDDPWAAPSTAPLE